MTEPALHPTSGDHLLARRGALVLLCSADQERGDTVDELLAAHQEVAAAGGDGTALADRLAGILSATAGELSLVVFGPAGSSLLVAVYGHAWASVTTEHGEQNLAMRQSRDGVRSVLPGHLVSVRAGLGDIDLTASPQRWVTLDAGVVAAGGLIYLAADAPMPTAEPPARPRPDTAEVPVLHNLIKTPVAGPAPTPAPAAEPSVPDDGPPTQPTAAEPAAVATPPPPAPAPPPQPTVDRSQKFSSVVLAQGGSTAETPVRAPLPIVTAPPEPVAPDIAPAAHPADEGRAQVLGVYCKNGHFDDPAARYCAICGISMAQLTLVPRPGPRPPLGVLVLDDGSIFSLDTDYVIGRDPSQDPDVLAGTARPLRFEDAEGVLSRKHARVVLDGWQVQIVDLGSANGTAVLAPGDPGWSPIPARTAVPIRPGTQVGLGRRNLRYESHRNT